MITSLLFVPFKTAKFWGKNKTCKKYFEKYC